MWAQDVAWFKEGFLEIRFSIHIYVVLCDPPAVQVLSQNLGMSKTSCMMECII